MELITTDAQRLTAEPIISLFEIDAKKYGETILRFTPSFIGEAMDSVSFGGNVYQTMAIEASGFEWNGTGSAARPTLSITPRDLLFLTLLTKTRDLTGCPVRRIRTHRKYLDDGASPNPAAHYPIDYYKVERKTTQHRNELTYELSTGLDQEGKQIPARQIIRDTCMHRFRYWANGRWNYEGVTCPYAGAAMYTRSGQPTTDPTKAQCGKHRSDCQLHFGKTAVLPMFAFPGVGRVSS